MIHSEITNTNNVVDSFSDTVAEYALIPALKFSYQLTGEIVQRTIGIFSRSLSQRIVNALEDPLSTSSTLKLTKGMAYVLQFEANRIPTKISGFHYVDQSLISMNQHLYTYVKHVNDLLEVPQNLKKFITDFSFETLVMQFSNTGPKSLSFINRAIITLKRAALNLIKLAFRIIDILIQCYTFGVQFEPFEYLYERLGNVKSNIGSEIISKTLKSVEKKEIKLRKDIVQLSVNYSLDYLVKLVTSATIKSVAGLAFYFFVKEGIEKFYDVPDDIYHTFGGLLATGIIWGNVIKPTFDPYYETYDPTFKAERLSLRKFCNFFYVKSLHPFLQVAKTFFQVID